jgi:hypothetical protein
VSVLSGDLGFYFDNRDERINNPTYKRAFLWNFRLGLKKMFELGRITRILPADPTLLEAYSRHCLALEVYQKERHYKMIDRMDDYVQIKYYGYRRR